MIFLSSFLFFFFEHRFDALRYVAFLGATDDTEKIQGRGAKTAR